MNLATKWIAVGLGWAALFSFAAQAAEGDPELPPAVTALDPANDMAPLPPDGAPPPKGAAPVQYWYRDAGEYLASRSTRKGAPTDANSKLITDAKRFDVSLGKRVPLVTWADDGQLYQGWSFGFDGAILASLTRYTNVGRLTFATNTFDGMFGLWLGFMNGDGWLALLRTGHLSAHLVDNSPLINTPIGYSQFWNELIVGKSFPETRRESDWDLHLQGSVGLNHTSTPTAAQPRASLGVDFGYALAGPNSLAIIASADALRAGVSNQRDSYETFLGFGYLSRPQTTHRPFRAGVAHFTGSDYRNQLYQNRQHWLTFEVATEL